MKDSQNQSHSTGALDHNSRSRWRGQFARLARMSRDELLTRVGQGFSKRWDSSALLRSWNQSSYRMDTVPRANEVARFFFSTQEIPQITGLIGKLLPGQVQRIVDQADRICRHQFDLLGYKNLDYGREIDWHRDAVSGKRAPLKIWYKIPYLNFAEVGDHKVIWELNRHQHLLTLARAYCSTKDERYVRELCAQWYHWKKENPYPLGINWASSLEVAFRSLSWLWVRQLLADCPALPCEFHYDLLEALAQNGRHISRNLSTYFSPNTHLLGEAVALFFLGTLCPQIRAAANWQKQGWEIILAEAEKQIFPDGMHFEQSLYYHVYALDLFLHARILAQRNALTVPAFLDRTIEKMAEILCVLGRTGVPPRLGDDDGGRVFDPSRNRAKQLLDPLSTAAVLFRRADFKAASQGLCEETLWLLGTKGLEEFDKLPSMLPAMGSRAFDSSGIYVMASGESSTQLVARAGPMGALRAGHSHCDSLSVHLSIDGREILSDPGTHKYVSGDGERETFRGTSAHNTLRIGGEDQAKAGDSFSWNSLPSVRVEHWISEDTFDLLEASHSGYQRLEPPALHRR
ncbi:MAG: alginate lyase family protein, partial [Candidatus Acidiferrales bacterium]